MKTNLACSTILTGFLAGVAAPPTLAADDAELAKQSLNPIAALISLPMQYNYDSDIGPTGSGKKSQLNIQPVIPFSISTDWNLISRTILPMINQKDVAPGSGTQSGIGDVTQSLFFSPKKATGSGWIWGAGPVLLLPTGGDNLSANKWGLGPTAVFLKQQHGWTYGGLANHVWSVGGSGNSDISSTFVQPFLSYTNKNLTSFGINTESTYNWKSKEWAVPVNLTVTQMLKIGDQPLTIQGGVRYWADSPDRAGPENWGFRLAVTFLFPK